MRDVLITSSVLILAILLIRRFTKGKINPLFQYSLWLLVVLRLINPFFFGNSSVSIMNLFPQTNTLEYMLKGQAGVNQSIDQNQPEMAQGQAEQLTSQTVIAQLSKSQLQSSSEMMQTQTELPSNQTKASAANLEIIKEYLPIAWLAGVFLVGGYMFFYQIKWKRYLLKNRKQLKGVNRYRNTLWVYTVEGLPSPCLSGRSIYLTEEMAEDERQLAHILAHEYCHYRHLDSLWVIVRCILVAVYWFHPLVWAAAYASKQDSEFACDEAAIRLLGEKERFAYGRTLIKLITDSSYDKSRMGIASTMSGGEKGIRERISMVAKKPKYLFTLVGIVVLLVIVLITVTFSGAEQAADVVAQEEEALAEDAQLQEEMKQLDARLQEEMKQLQDEMEKIKAKQADMETKRRGEEAEALADYYAQLQEKMKMLQDKSEQLKSEQAILEEMEKQEDDSAFMEKLISFEDDFTNAINKSGQVETYYIDDEGLYLLESRKGPDDMTVSIYGLHTKEYGYRGIKLVVNDEVNNFDLPWIDTAMCNREENLRLYGLHESIGDGMLRTFGFKMCRVNTSDSEVWGLYIGDRFETGIVELSEFTQDDYMAQMKERLSFKIAESENKIYVYDSGMMIGAIEIPQSVNNVGRIEEVVLDGSAIDWELGYFEEEIRLITAIGLKLTGEEKSWYYGLNLISFPVDCGEFGNRTFTLGQASIETDHVNNMIQNISAAYANPCPAYTRISDSFGNRIHPTTGEVKMHEGVDFAAEEGADIVAAAEGEVYETGFHLHFAVSVNGEFVEPIFEQTN